MTEPQKPDLQTAQAAFERVRAKIDAVDPDHLSPQNFKAVAAVSRALGALPVILAHRERALTLPEFNIEDLDDLPDYALAVWYLDLTDFSPPRPSRVLEDSVLPLRRKLLSWAQPLAESGFFEQSAIAKIRKGFGSRDAAGDLVAIATLYRAHWSEIKNACGVTEDELEAAEKIGSAVFTAVSRRATRAPSPPSEHALRLRKAWTLFDRAYKQCRRAVGYFRFIEEDIDTLVPNLRRNPGRRPTRPAKPKI